MTTASTQAGSPPPPAPSRPTPTAARPVPAVKPSGSLSYTVQKGAGLSLSKAK